MRSLIKMIALGFGLLLLVAACAGGASDRSSASVPAPASPTETPSTPDAAEPDTPEPTPITTAPDDVEESASAATVATPVPTETPTAVEEEATTESPAAPQQVDFDRADNSFSEYIQPIMERSCASCHGPDLAGSDHFVIRTAADIANNATSIDFLASQRLMPPWPASTLSPHFVDDPSLTDEEIARLVAWVEDGAPLDVDPATPVVNSKPESRLVGDDRDVVMTPAGGASGGNPQNVDEYRCLMYEPGNDEVEHIVATHFEPDQTQVVHHAVVTLASADLRDRAAELDAADPGPGWSCFGGFGFGRGSAVNTTRLPGWAPGTQPSRQPDGYAVPLKPGDFVVVQVHYHYDGSAPADASRYVLALASDEELEANGGSFNELTNALYLGPAEIPCYDGDTDPLCDRDVALQRSRDLYGDRVALRPDFFLNRCGASVSDFADMTDGTAWSTCDLPVTNPGRIHSVFGHMHELGLSIRLTLNPDTAEERVLLDIPDWNFEWQFGYTPVDDIVIDRDDTIRVDCAWNRERAPYEAVGYILWADGTGDEMCYSAITTVQVDG